MTGLSKILEQIAENVFQPLRDGLGVPIYVSSGYRSPDLNRAIGGSKRSQHMEGRALDLDCGCFRRYSNCDIFHYIKNNLEFDQLVWEFGDEDNPDWVHVSYVRTTVIIARGAFALAGMIMERFTTK